MAPPSDRRFPIPHPDPSARTSVRMGGHRADGLPAALSGRLLGAHQGVVHAVRLGAGNLMWQRSRRVRPEAEADSRESDVFAFEGSILAYVPRSLACELGSELETVRSVDLGGRFRPLTVCPRRDPFTGDLHLLAVTSDGGQAHIVIAPGALTRRIRHVPTAREVGDLVITRDHVLFMSAGAIGVTTRDSESRVDWIATGAGAPGYACAYDVVGDIVMHVTTPRLERWVLQPASATMSREVLDRTPQRFVRGTSPVGDAERQLLWTVGERAVDVYDITHGRHHRHDFGTRQPGDLVFVADPSRPGDADGGWLVGFVHDAARTDLIVLDAADISRGAIAEVRVRGRIPSELHTTWIPDTDQ